MSRTWPEGRERRGQRWLGLHRRDKAQGLTAMDLQHALGIIGQA